MRKLVLLTVALASWGCGSQFDGSWTGTWTAAMYDGSLQSGDLTMEFADGEADGSGTNAVTSERFTEVGSSRRGRRTGTHSRA